MKNQINRIVHLLVILALLLPAGIRFQPVSAATPSQNVPETGLYRAKITLPDVAARDQIDAMGVVVLEEGSPLVVLVTAQQLGLLARLQYQPRHVSELNRLAAANSEALGVQAIDIQSNLDQAAMQWQAAQTEDRDLSPLEGSDPMKPMLSELSAEALTEIASAISPDTDGDGLTDTEESWWCTDLNNPNTDGDANGYSDGQEVAALLNADLPRQERWAYGPPFGPPNAWPNWNQPGGCNDGDFDTIPDKAEAYMVGTRVGTGNSENTDGDKFDDGQELFGTTYCPGSPNSCGWGSFPRTQDYSFITSGMPSWVKSPGDSPFVAAYPVIKLEVDPATVKVTTKQIQTVERTITQGEEISSGFTETKGNSTTVGTVDTNTHSTWQEHSTTEGTITPQSYTIPTQETIQTFSLPQISAVEAHEQPITDYLCLLGSRFEIIDAEAEEICQSLQLFLQSPDSEIMDLIQYPVMVTSIQRQTTADKATDSIVEWMPVFDENLAPTGSAVYPFYGEWKDNNWQWIYPDISSDVDQVDPKMNMSGITAGEPTRITGFYLPWREGEKASITQSEFGTVSHSSIYAYDFANNSNFSIAAIAGGEVLDKYEDSNGNCPSIADIDVADRNKGQKFKYCTDLDDPLDPKDTYSCEEKTCEGKNCGVQACTRLMNFVQIRHDDGSIAYYWHLLKDSVSFEKGNRVGKGSVIGRVGTTGWSTNNHLHLQVMKDGKTIPIGFAEVPLVDGKLNTGGPYTSQNKQASSCTDQQVSAPPPASASAGLAPQNKPQGFIEFIGQKISNWIGRFFRRNSSQSAVPGCSEDSCAEQVAGATDQPVSYPEGKTTSECGGSNAVADSSMDGLGVGGGSGMTNSFDGSGWSSLRIWSETTTNGEGWSTSHSDLRMTSEYSEVSRSTTNTLVSTEAWSTAITVDPTQAAQLTFNYLLQNTGSDALVNMRQVDINIQIGSLPVITWRAPDRSNLMPGQYAGPFGSDVIPLTLDQLAAIDNGAPIRVLLASYSYDDQLYEQNAWGSAVQFHVDDGVQDGDESVDKFLITTGLIPGETYQDVLARFLPTRTFYTSGEDERNGTLVNIRTPEFDASGEITSWQDHPVGPTAWWEIAISSGGETSGIEHFKDMPAKPKTDVWLRYIVDSDADGYSDRAEADARTDPNNPERHPSPQPVVVKQTQVSGSQASVQIALQNLGSYDASSVEVWAVAPDDSITITDGLIGGGGRVRAGSTVLLGARLGAPNLTNWKTSTAMPYPSGQYQGVTPRTYLLRVDSSGAIGSTVGLTISWSDNNGSTWQPLAVGNGYTSLSSLDLSDGVKVAFASGTVTVGETASFQAVVPIDTIAYTIQNPASYTPPLIVVSYNDAQGNHKFVTDAEAPVNQIDLAAYLGQMRYGLQLDTISMALYQSGENQSHILFYNPTRVTLSGARLYTIFATPEGEIAKEYVSTGLTLKPGPNVIPVTWNTAEFSPAYDATKDYHILVFLTDRQGTIIENTLKDLDRLGEETLPQAVIPTEVWEIGSVVKGTLLQKQFAIANTGRGTLNTFIDAPAGIRVSLHGIENVAASDASLFDVSVNTGEFIEGAFEKTITIYTSDPRVVVKRITIRGTVTPAAPNPPSGAVLRPLNDAMPISGTFAQGDWVELPHSLGPDPQTIHPVKIYNADYSRLWGVGRYAADFGQDTASFDLFGDGRDGDLTVAAGQTVVINSVRVNVTASGSNAGPANSNGFSAGDIVLFHQTQGTANMGRYEYARILSINSATNWTLAKPLTHTYDNTNGRAQVIRVPQYRNVTIQSGGVLTAPNWNGGTGGIVTFRCSGNLSLISGNVVASAMGYQGGPRIYGAAQHGIQGEGIYGPGGRSRYPNNGGGGGGPGSGDGGAGSGGGSYASAGGDGKDPFYSDPGLGSTTLYGDPQLNTLFFGGAGGSGGTDDSAGGSGFGGRGGNGGGIVFFSARTITGNGSIVSNGGNGEDHDAKPDSEHGGGGGGAGGSISITFGTANFSSINIQAYGGTGGRAKDGSAGGGGLGRVKFNYCDTYTGGSYPGPTVSKLTCFIAEQSPTNPQNTRLNLPEAISGTRTYQVQYGRLYAFSAAGTLAQFVRLPKQLYTSVNLDALVSNVSGTAPLGLSLDVGANGTVDWQDNTTTTFPATFNLTSLTSAINEYLVSRTDVAWGENIDVPFQVSANRQSNIILTNLRLTPAGSTLRYLRIPANTYSDLRATLRFQQPGVSSGPLAFHVDVGDDGTIDAAYTGTVSFPTEVETNSLANAINAYLVGREGDIDVPLRITPAPSLEVDVQSYFAMTETLPDVTVLGITPSVESIVEGDTISLEAGLQNSGTQPSSPFVAAFYLVKDGIETYLGSQFVAPIPAGQAAATTLPWNTLRSHGTLSLRVVLDPFDRLLEADETNNAYTREITILTRPDLTFAPLTLSNPEPISGETVTINLSLKNTGQANAVASKLDLYDGDPAQGNLIGSVSQPVAGGAQVDEPLTWTPNKPGLHRIIAVSDGEQQVRESDENNNLAWKDIYVGFTTPLRLDSGTAGEPVYAPESGYGVEDKGQADVLSACTSNDPAANTIRRDPDGSIIYRFDHLLPGHFYHLDLTLFECDGAGRQESVLVDNQPVAGPEDLGDGKIHRLSLRLDPALYLDHAITVKITAPGIDGAVVSEVNLHDIDYRYSDAGGSQDPQYTSPGSYGWLDGTVQTTWGTQPYQSVRVDQGDNALRYRFDRLDPAKHYRVHFTFWQPSGTGRIQKVQIDGADTGLVVNLGDYQRHNEVIQVPTYTYATDGSIEVGIIRTNASVGAMINEIALEEETLPVGLACTVQETPYFSDVYGMVKITGTNAPSGSVVQALNPRGDVVGCFTVTNDGQYGFMRIYGEDTSASPAIPGMRSGEMVSFKINGAPAAASPLLYWQNDQVPHNVDLNGGNISGQSILLKPGWNLISFNVEPPAPIIGSVLQSINGRYDRVLGETGMYSPTLPDQFNTLKETHAWKGYYVRVTGTTSVSLLVDGIQMACETPIPLHAGWNWIGGPCQTTDIETALQSIQGQYLRVLSLDKAHDVALPAYSTLKQLQPGEGYLIYVNQNTTLTYPSGAPTAQALEADEVLDRCTATVRTPESTLIYGEVQINGQPAPAGARVEAITPRGEVSGCYVITEAGTLNLTHIYGSSESDYGFQAGEPVELRVNGLLAELSNPLEWQPDRMTNPVVVSVESSQIFLPIIGAGQK